MRKWIFLSYLLKEESENNEKFLTWVELNRAISLNELFYSKCNLLWSDANVDFKLTHYVTVGKILDLISRVVEFGFEP